MIKCDVCGSRQRDRATYRIHKKRAHGDEGHTSVTSVTQVTLDRSHQVTPENPNSDADISQVTQCDPVPSSSPSVSKGGSERVTLGSHLQSVTPIFDLAFPGSREVQDPQARFREAVSFLSAWQGLLQPGFEVRLYLAAKYKIDSNGESKPFSSDQLDKLFEIEAVVRGLVEDIKASREDNLRAMHGIMPPHPPEGCRECERAAEDKRRAEEGLREDWEQLRLLAEARGRPWIDEDGNPLPLTLPDPRSPRKTTNPPADGANSGGPADA